VAVPAAALVVGDLRAHARSRGVVLNASSEFAVGEQQPRRSPVPGDAENEAGSEQVLGRVVDALNDRAPAARVV
jgi:hypothetical protein